MDNSHTMAFSSLFSPKLVKGIMNSNDTAEIPINELELETKSFAEGGGGKLYRGLYKKKIKIAAKTVLEDMSLTDLEEFRQEYRILTKLRHPNIMRTFGTSLDPKTDTLYLVAEMCEGGSIVNYINSTNLKSTPATFGIMFSKVFEAINYMHNVADLVHRDLKPLNVLLGTPDDISTIKICDMGLACQKSSSISINVGTAMYMPPEAFHEEEEHLGEHHDAFSWDVYSLSGIMVEVWCRAHPWAKFAHHKIITRVNSGKRPDFPKKMSVPPALRSLIQAMWAQDHTQRPTIAQVVTLFAPIAQALSEHGASHESWNEVQWEDVVVADVEVPSEETGLAAEETETPALPRVRSLNINANPEVVDADWTDEVDELSLLRKGEISLVEGWHSESGSLAHRAAALAKLWSGKPLPTAEDMTKWYLEGPWKASFPPHRWAVEEMKILIPTKFMTSASRALGITVVAGEDRFSEKLRTGVGHRVSTYLVCGYLTPHTRLVKCIGGFVSPEEKVFPYMLQTIMVDFAEESDDEDEAVEEIGDEESISFDSIYSGGGKPKKTRSSMGDLAAMMSSPRMPSRRMSTSATTTPRPPPPPKTASPHSTSSDSSPRSTKELGFTRKASLQILRQSSHEDTSSLDCIVVENYSPIRGSVRVLLRDKPFKCLHELGHNFWNVRSSFKVLSGMVDLGNHMSIVKLKNGKFLCLGVVDPNSWAEGQTKKGDLKKDIDRLTRGGSLIEAVVATHPFHTSGFEPFVKIYGISSDTHPNGIKYYGTPRHLRRLPELNWSGDVTDAAVQVMWHNHGLELRVPEGVEFHDPQPAPLNHFPSVFAYHSPSKVLHNDDCLCYFNQPGRKMGLLTRAAPNVRHGQLRFHQSFDTCGMTVPDAFKKWFVACLDDWPFESLCTAHNGVLIGNANRRARDLLDEMAPVFIKVQEERNENPYVAPPINPMDSKNELNCECG